MRNIFYIICCFLLFGCKPEASYTLNIIHTNDLHSHVLPFNDHEDCDIDNTECLGGFARIITFMKQEKQQNPNTLFIDAGDRFTGTAFYALTKSRFLLPLFQMMPYDAATLGNHEFDDNLNDTISFISKWQTPVTVANLDIDPQEKLYHYISPSIVLKKNKRKIGIIGVITPEINIVGTAKISVTPIKNAVAREVKKLKEQNINIIVVISHIGLDKDIKLAKAVPDIDIIVGGHSHSLLTNDKNNPLRRDNYPMAVNSGKTLIVSSGMGGRYVGKLTVKFDKNGEIVNYFGDTFAMSAEIYNDKQAEKIIRQAAKFVQQAVDEKITELSQSYGYTANTDYCSEECPIGEYISYLLAQEYPNIDAVLINSGAIRSTLAKGNIKFNHLLELYPYDNPAVLIKLSGKELKKYLRHGITHYHKNGKTNELLQTYGIHYEFSTDNKELHNILVQNKPLDINKQYTILTSLFLAEGGDKYPIIPYTETGHTVREILLKQLKKPQNALYTFRKNVQIFKKP